MVVERLKSNKQDPSVPKILIYLDDDVLLPLLSVPPWHPWEVLSGCWKLSTEHESMGFSEDKLYIWSNHDSL